MIQHVVDAPISGHVDVTEWVDGFQLVTRNPGGFWTAALTLRLEFWRAWQWWQGWPGGTYTVRGEDEVVWTGDLTGISRGGPQTVLRAQGDVAALRDIEAWTMYADSDYGWWYALDSDAFQLDNNNRVFVSSRSGVRYATGDQGRMVYPETGVVLGRDIIRVEATVEVVITTGSWSAELRNAAGTVLVAYTVTTSTTFALSIAATSGLRWALEYTGAGGTGEATARLTDVIVRTLNPTNTEDVFEDVVVAAGISVNSVASTGIAFDAAAYQGRDRRWDVFEDVQQLGDGTESWVATVYEFGADLLAWESDPRWVITPEQVAALGLQQDREDIFNAVRAQLPDGYLSAWQTDADSIARYGRREYTLRLGQTSQAEAVRLAQVFLADRAEAYSGIRLDAGLEVERADGSIWPSYFIRAGDVVRMRDLLADEDVDIRVQETVFDGRVMRIVPEGAPNRLEVVLAGRGRLGVAPLGPPPRL